MLGANNRFKPQFIVARNDRGGYTASTSLFGRNLTYSAPTRQQVDDSFAELIEAARSQYSAIDAWVEGAVEAEPLFDGSPSNAEKVSLFTITPYLPLKPTTERIASLSPSAITLACYQISIVNKQYSDMLAELFKEKHGHAISDVDLAPPHFTIKQKLESGRSFYVQ